jgi:hypothetical protein
MTKSDIFVTLIRSAGDLAGVFECDDETGVFYLYRTAGEAGHKVIDAIPVCRGIPVFQEDDIRIGWDANETRVGLFIGEQLSAVFDTVDGTKYGGEGRGGTATAVTPEIRDIFDSRKPA